MIEGIIYRYISPSGKSYIGQTTRELYRRRMWFGPGRYTGRNGISKIDRARRKYGPENFEYEILLRNQYSSIELATEDLNRWESYYIGLYDSYKNGYNCTLGGDGSRGYCPSDDTLRKLSESLKGKSKPEGFGDKISRASKGRPKSALHRKHLSESRKNSGKRILQYSLNGELIQIWDNIDVVSRHFAVSRESIAGCCRGKSKTAHKFVWRYCVGNIQEKIEL